MRDDSHSTGAGGGESIIERAMRMAEAEERGSSSDFTRDDHREIVNSGAADLSGNERVKLFDGLTDRTGNLSPRNPSSRPIPLFFGSWSGMNPFRFLKPFHVSRKRD